MAIASAALFGWWGNIAWLTSWGTDWPTLKPVAALCFLGLGIVLAKARLGSVLAQRIGIGVVAMAALSLFQDITGLDLPLERWLGPRGALPGPGAGSMRMAPATATALACAAAAMAVPEQPRWQPLHIATIVVMAGIGAVSLFGFLVGIETVDRFFPITSLSLPATVALIVLAGVLCARLRPSVRLSRPRPLAQLLFLLGIAIAGPLLLLGSYVGVQVFNAQSEEVRQELMRSTQTLSAAIDREIIGEIETLKGLAGSPSLDKAHLPDFQRQAEAALTVRDRGAIHLLDASGRQLVNTRVPFGTQLPEFGDPELARRVLESAKPGAGGLFMGNISKALQFAIALPLTGRDGQHYVLVRAPELDSILAVVASQPLRDGWLSGLSDGSDRLIARSRDNNTFIGQTLSEETKTRSKGRAGVFDTVDLEGRPSVQAFVWSDFTGWRTAVWAPRAVLDAPVRAFWRTMLVLSMIALGLVTTLGLWLSRAIAGAFRDTANAANATADGEPHAYPSGPVAEANALARALIDANAGRAKADAALRESEATFRAMFSISSVGKVQVDPQTGRFLRANAAFCELTGYSEPELLALTFVDITHPGDRDRDREGIRRLVAGEAPAFDVEKRFTRKDGSVVWARVTVNVICDDHGRPLRNTAVVQDFTARKLSEDALRESEAFGWAVFESSPDCVKIIDADGNLERMNVNGQRCMEIDDFNTVCGLRWPTLWPQEERGKIEAARAEALAGRVGRFSGYCPTMKGAPRWWDVMITAIPGINGEPKRLFASSRDVTELKRAETALRESAERLMAASSAAHFGIYHMRVAQGISKWSRELVRILGLGDAEMDANFDTLVGALHPDEREKTVAGMQASMRRVGYYEVEYRILRPDGEVRWLLDRGEAIGPLDPGTGLVARVTGTVIDITERKRNEEQITLLMREVNHRAKNMLGLVQAIARLTAASNPKEFAEHFSQRIQALAVNQDLLVRNDWQGIGIDGLVRGQLAHFADLTGTRITLGGPALRLSSAAAQAIELALHELATNAGKYGALSTADGCVEINWRLDGDVFQIGWIERNGPPVQPPQRKGFGTTVIASMAKMSVDGAVEFTYAATGVVWRLTCPAVNALEQSAGGGGES